MAAIETSGLTKVFGDVVAVDDLDLTVEEGEVFGFLGPNGAGKSTTIDVLLDFVRPTDGSARVFGLDTRSDAPAIRERLGVLPEGYRFDAYLTGREYVEWAVETKAAADDPAALLETVGLLDVADRRASGYSKGMQQRLAFGMALAGDPDLLVLDEPSTGMDPNGIQQLRSIVRNRADGGTTVFLSSHVLSEVEAVCDRVGVMNDGRLVAVDTIAGLRESAGVQTTITVRCAEPPSAEDVEELDGVASVAVDGTTLIAECTEPSAKPAVVRHVDERATVVDVEADDTSLEELFNELTDGGRDADRHEHGSDAQGVSP